MLAEASAGTDTLLRVRDLTVAFPAAGRPVRPVDGVTFELGRGEVHCIVGESGSGKSMTALAIVGLVPPPGRVESGEVWLERRNLLALADRELQPLRGNEIGFIFQDPRAALDPTMSVGAHIVETIQAHRNVTRRAAEREAIEMLAVVGIDNPQQRARDYPHQFSGGMAQRATIAAAICCKPSLLIADEPTTALDVTVQKSILDLLERIAAEMGMGILLITHDFGVAARLADRISVMYAGRIVETAEAEVLFARPRMPYTQALLEALPTLDDEGAEELRAIEGAPPSLFSVPEGCRFAPRCPIARAKCVAEEPQLTTRSDVGHLARCWATEPGGWA